MAGIWERATMIAKSNINELLDKYEDPEKVISQAVIEAKEEYAKTIKLASSSVLADEKIALKNYEKAKEDADKWHAVAANAMKANDEEAAYKALENEGEYRAKSEALQKAYEASKTAADKVRENLDRMKDEINAMENKAAEIRSKAATAKTFQAAANVSSRGIKQGAFDAFERMEKKADRQLAQAESLQDLNRDRKSDDKEELLKKYSNTKPDTNEALARLKEELGM